MIELQHEFEAAMWRIYKEAKDLGYHASYFARMLDDMGGLATAKKLINDKQVSDGFTRLWELGALKLSVEAVSLRPEFRALFTNVEREISRRRLRDYGYEAP